MVESVETSRIEELLARLAKLEVELAQLTVRSESDNRRLVKKFETLELKVKQLSGHLSNLWSDFMDQRAAVSGRFEAAFERIMNLELFVFPNLLRDMASVHHIIGFNAEMSPLDSRKTFPRSEKEEPDSA
jgi:hypothetical protein